MHQQMHRIVGNIEEFPWRLTQQRFIAAVHAVDQVVAIELRTQHRQRSRELTYALAELFLLPHRDSVGGVMPIAMGRKSRRTRGTSII